VFAFGFLLGCVATARLVLRSVIGAGCGRIESTTDQSPLSPRSHPAARQATGAKSRRVRQLSYFVATMHPVPDSYECRFLTALSSMVRIIYARLGGSNALNLL
jgi:hypothetical protein